VINQIDKHRRINDILLGPLERPALKWLAAHMPAWVTPDICTIIGLVAAFGIFISYVLSTYDRNFLWLASFFYIVNWFGDSLDGTLARYRHIERPVFGFFIDHTLDAFSQLVIMLGLGLTPHVSFNIASLLLIGYLLLSVLVYIRTSVVGEFKISYGRLGPTEIRVIAILLNTGMYFGGARVFSIPVAENLTLNLNPYDLIVGSIAALLFSFFIVTATKETIRLAKENK
jgi:archaetidylinositol phosphate synthase